MADTAASSTEPCRILVMASGNGTNFQALIDAVSSGRIPNSRIVRLFVNRKTAYATKRAEQAGVPWEYFNMIAGGFQAKGEKDPQRLTEARERYDAALAEKVKQERPDLIVLAGWMHVFTGAFLAPLGGLPTINLHPALPGKYDGASAIERAYEDFKAGKLENNRTGIMVHFVIQQVDRGQPIMVQEIECREGESLEQLEERIHSHEHELIVKATAKVVGDILAKREQR
ncbi:Phosphoribosylglycinamide formyltransferase [Pleurostoma richardsiae]|uniref:Phosphoribosylglycinamide formyltransferase n=1 Tax=Pleurostoma richardsiae TaxID=41990 RepID=A0AA38W0T4_9PEZI|nr:Phosphoribosylglycinamide formyltransferase [Pleurostoma richardsiae]